MHFVEIIRRQDPEAVDRILRTLPAWFSVEEAIVNYVESASLRDSFLAVIQGHVIGVALVIRHFPQSAELSLIAVDANHRGNGVGSALVNAISASLFTDGCKLLQVRTVGPSFEDDAYSESRAFYRRAGFLPLQEFERIDWDGPSLVLVKPLQKPQQMANPKHKSAT
ncbi:GNAT family N-acetyltransferase [Paenarthrobacter sp. JL.01a]|uniref:GNAT family N-acetyltransferase n=1 Tax=Paenarthrobacter sp. JL.01a TaxID=2979324 RepID=UPI0021C887B3|nr:GNAT family N-acetyltransferase [Paenarthrobacter sp. JL.01a]UXM91600.1 GNAT family N-acetyltransferase [Paenarthrobacter sp. JL.01a]